MTAFPCYDRVADTLWSFANGEKEAKDRKVFLKGNKLMCYSERHNGSGEGFCAERRSTRKGYQENRKLRTWRLMDEECKDTRRLPDLNTEGVSSHGEGDF